MDTTDTVTLVAQLENLANEVDNLRERLVQTAEEWKRTTSIHASGVAAELADFRKSLLDLAGRLQGLEQSLPPSAADSVSEELVSPAPKVEDVVSLRPAGPEERLPARPSSSLGKKWEETEARLAGLSQLIERALQAESAEDAAMNLGNLALEYHHRRKYEEAERLYRHALAFREKFFGPDHPLVATILNNLAILCRDQERYDEAVPLFLRSLAITEKTAGPEHPKAVRRLANVADLYLRQGKDGEAKPLFERLLTISEKQQSAALPEVRASLKKYADFLRRSQREEEAAAVDTRVRSMQAERREETSANPA